LPSISSSYLEAFSATRCGICGPASLAQHRLRRCETRKRHAVRRAAHVVQTELVAELDGLRLAAVLAANAELDVGLRRAPALDADPHHVSDPDEGAGLERVLV